MQKEFYSKGITGLKLHRKDFVVYDAGNNPLEVTISNYVDSIWQIVKQVTNKYNLSGNHTSSLLRKWDSGLGEWIDETDISSEYDFSGNEITFVLKQRDNQKQTLKNKLRLTLDKEWKTTNNNKNKQKATNVRVFPNPAKQVLNVSVEGKSGHFQLYNINGKKLMNEILYNSQQIKLDRLTPGVYFYIIYVDGIPVSQDKLIVK